MRFDGFVYSLSLNLSTLLLLKQGGLVARAGLDDGAETP